MLFADKGMAQDMAQKGNNLMGFLWGNWTSRTDRNLFSSWEQISPVKFRICQTQEYWA